VTLAAGAMPVGATHVPALPQTQAGQNVTVSTAFSWTPTAAQVGPHTLVYSATDQLAQIATCTIHVNVVPVGSGNASSTAVGIGCVASGQYPELRCDPPILGTTVDLEITHGLPNWLAIQVFSFSAPVPVLWWPGCYSYMDVNTSVTLGSATTNALGVLHTPISIPNHPSFIGLPLTVQGFFLGTSDVNGIRATNGLYLVLGN